MDFLPYGRQVIEDDDIAAVAAVLRSDYLTTGPGGPAFEAAFAAAMEATHAIACSSGTAALHLVAMALDLGPGTVSVVPSITFLATANAVVMTGGDVVFADVDPDTGLMTPATLEAAIARAGRPVKAVFPVHIGGQTCDLPALAEIAETAGAVLVDDACHAIGTRYTENGVSHAVGAGAHSVATAFSLHPVKTIAAGEGGVVTTRDPALAEKMALLRNHGMSRDAAGFTNRDLAFAPDGTANPWYYEMQAPGLNYRLTDFQAALVRNQLAKLPRFAATRRAIAAYYERELAALAPLVRPVTKVEACDPVLHLYQVLIDFEALGLSRAAVMAELRAAAIGTQVHYIPVHRQPFYSARHPGLDLPGADAFYEKTLSLPLSAAMTESDAARVVAALAALCARAQGRRPSL